jgi:hypothetical protein
MMARFHRMNAKYSASPLVQIYLQLMEAERRAVVRAPASLEGRYHSSMLSEAR